MFVLSLVLAACGEATTRPVVNIDASTLFIEQPGFVEVTMKAVDNSFDKKPTSCTMTIDDDSQPITFENGEWSGYIRLSKTTTFTGDCFNEAGQTQNALTITVANGYDETNSWEYTDLATMQNSCIGSFGKETQIGTKNYNGVVVINKADAVEGFSLEAERDYITDITSLNGHRIPQKEEMGNDAFQVVYCEPMPGKVLIYVFERDLSSETAYNTGSYFEMSADGTITLWHDDVNHHDGWYGTPSGSYHSYNAAGAFTSWDSAYRAYGDELQMQFDAIQVARTEIKSGAIPLHDHMWILSLWVQ